MNPEREGSSAAAAFRQDHHLGLQPLGDLIALIEQTTGIDVAVLDAGPDVAIVSATPSSISAVKMFEPSRFSAALSLAGRRRLVCMKSTHQIAPSSPSRRGSTVAKCSAT